MDLSKKIITGLQRRWGPVLQKQVVNIIAYGSGAMPQTNDKNAFNKVRQASIFHHQLIRICPQDYAGAAYFLKWTGETIFPMHSNHIELEGKRIKYSIVSMLKLRQDLYDWNLLSFAGRLQKPFLAITPLKDGLDAGIARNRQSATAIALLMLGGKARNLPHWQLFLKICQLSYIGDIRFSVAAQNPKKVSNIVHHNFNLFQQIYLPILNKFSQKIKPSLQVQQNNISFLYTPESLSFLLPFMPVGIIQKLMEIYPGQKKIADRILLAGASHLPLDLKDIICRVNRRSSFWMAAQNLITGSPLNNMEYILAKLKKRSK